jgi:hypothetical protein
MSCSPGQGGSHLAHQGSERHVQRRDVAEPTVLQALKEFGLKA